MVSAGDLARSVGRALKEEGGSDSGPRWSAARAGRRGLSEGGPACQGRGADLALGERGDAGACAGRAGWAAAQSWRAECVRVEAGPSRTGAAWASGLGWAQEKGKGGDWAGLG